MDFLFSFRGSRISSAYINQALIPMLCDKAGVPREDGLGRITSHRARPTTASQLFNAREPISLFELQQWLGHRSPVSTQHYAKINATKLAASFKRAGQTQLRVIEALLDVDAVKAGKAAEGEPYIYYDMGHGYCTYDYWSQCPHRMSCAKCPFYLPKESSRAQLLEQKANLERIQQTIKLTEDERRVLSDDLEAVSEALQTLADVPTPAGPTPRQLMKDKTSEKGA